MPTISFQPAHWAERALAYTLAIASLATVDAGNQASGNPPRPGRGSATQAELKAAEITRQQLHRLGISDIRRQSFSGLRSIWIFLSFTFGIALAGHAAFWVLNRPVGLWAASIFSSVVFALTAFLLWRKFTFRDFPFKATLPHGPSENVLGIVPSQGERKQRVVLLAHLDSHRAVILYAHDILTRLYTVAVPIVIYGVFAAPALYLLTALTGWFLLAYLGLALGITHFALWLTGATADLAPYSPGANDNAAAVGSLMALAERLRLEPLEHTEVWLAFTGCEETGCDGLSTLLAEYGHELNDAIWLDLELVGIGDRLVYLEREGIVKKMTIPTSVKKMLQEVSETIDIPIEGFDAGWHGVFTETGALWELGYNAACLMSLRGDSNSLPEWHRISDTSDKLELEALAKTHAYAWGFLQFLEQRS